jgi:hypothetical protein
LGDRFCEDRKFGTDEITELAMDARLGFVRSDDGVMIAFDVDVLAGFEDIGGAERDAKIATFATVGDHEDLPPGAGGLPEIERGTLDDSSAVHYWPFNQFCRAYVKRRSKLFRVTAQFFPRVLARPNARHLKKQGPLRRALSAFESVP